MADYNRNNRGAYRTSNQDWNEYRSRYGRDEDDERNYGSSSSDYRRSGNRDFDDSAGWQSRPERERDEYDRNSMYNSRYNRAYDNDSNYSSYAGERNYGMPNYGGSGNYGNPNYAGSGSSYSRERNLYDRDYEGMGRRGYTNSGTRLGTGNYGNRNFNEGMSQGRGGYGYSGRDHDERNRGDRNWWDRATDEVSSWFGDDEAERRRDQDRQMQGQHKGKGPKNYSRTEERIKDDVNDRLSDDPFIDATEIEVTVMGGEVTLTGIVDHRSTKRRAEDIAESVSGVKNVENRIRVGQTSDYRNSERDSQTTSGHNASAVPGPERNRKKDYVTS